MRGILAFFGDEVDPTLSARIHCLALLVYCRVPEDLFPPANGHVGLLYSFHIHMGLRTSLRRWGSHYFMKFSLDWERTLYHDNNEHFRAQAFGRRQASLDSLIVMWPIDIGSQ